MLLRQVTNILLSATFLCALLSPSGWAWAQDETFTEEPASTPPEDPFLDPTPTASLTASSASGTGLLPSGTWGLGVVQTVTGVRGPEIEYHLNNFLISGVIGLGFFSPSGGDSVSRVSFGAGGFYGIAGGDSTGLLVGARILLSHADVGASGVDFAIEAPLRAQWYVADHLSLHFEVGVAFAVLGDGSGGGTLFTIGRTNLVNNAGATVYF